MATVSVGVSLTLHGVVALRIAWMRPPPPVAREPPLELSTIAIAPVRIEPAPIAREPVVRAHASERRVRTPPMAPIAPTTATRPEPPRAPIDLFARDALAHAMRATPSDPGGHLARASDPAPPSDERETVAARVHEMLGEALARERAASGNVAPRWRAIERGLAQGFHPPLDVVKQESVPKAFAHQVLRAWLDGPPRTGTVPRGVDASVETPPGVPPGMNLRTTPMEQALAVQARWGDPATWMRVEVEITVDADGNIVARRVTRPSGRRAFDRTALAAVEDAVRKGGAPDEHRPVVTRWLVEAAMAVTPPTGIGFRFDESGALSPGAHGWRKYLQPTYPLQPNVQTHVSLVGVQVQR